MWETALKHCVLTLIGTKKHYFKLPKDLSYQLCIKKLQNLSPCCFKWRQSPFGFNLFRFKLKKVKHGTSWALQTALPLWSDEVF